MCEAGWRNRKFADSPLEGDGFELRFRARAEPARPVQDIGRSPSTFEEATPFSPRILTLRGILAKLTPEPVREPLRPKHYEPPRSTMARRRRRG